MPGRSSLPRAPKTGWAARLTLLGLAALLFLALSGLAVTLAPFHAAIQWTVIVHTLVGLLTVLPLVWYFAAHWADYRRFALSDTVLLGYVAMAALAVCLVSGLVVTWQGLFGLRMAPIWRDVHLWSTLAGLATGLAHVGLVVVRSRGRIRQRETVSAAMRPTLAWSLGVTLAGLALAACLPLVYSEPAYVNELPEDYSYLYGPDRPFAPSLARTESGGALDARSLSGSQSCGTGGCHQQILEEWQPSAHRYAAMDTLFQGVQKVMAEQNGPESTRYCGGCHDPISLFSGSKNLFSDDLTGHAGRDEGVSCLSCHAIRETDLQGNANYVMSQPAAYLWQWVGEDGAEEDSAARRVRDFLIRTYPDEHMKLSKRMFKTPEYCAACHKQFIDEEVNQVGWVQLQNQYDNWKSSHWFTEGDARKTVECRECHMPLVESSDPAAGDAADYNRRPNDGKHRSHRFIASNALLPEIHQLEGWQEQVALTEEWLRGETEIPEIAEKWAEGPVVALALEVPERVVVGEDFPLRVILTANKVGHDFPTGPLDIIQSWVELIVVDEAGEVVFSSGLRDEKNFIEPGTFLFKAEPVDRYGNLIDRHNLWEMVGVRFRRALFPGYSDTVAYEIPCPASPPSVELGTSGEASRHSEKEHRVALPESAAPGTYQVTARLLYRKVDQFLINFLLGEESGISAPVVEMTRATATVEIAPLQIAEVSR